MKIGSLELIGNVFLAPMAGITDPPFRRVVQGFGVSALWTEMISAKGLTAAPDRFSTIELAGHRVPTIFQISGYEPDVMADAAQRLQDLGAAAIDINMGCPARKVVQKGAGAALMKDLPLAGRLVAAIRSAVKIPITAKIRSGWNDRTQNAPALARVIENQGAEAIVIHSRSYALRHSGPASLEMIKQVKQAVQIPVIGNGGINSVSDAKAMLVETGCDGVMIGRGALGRPWLPGLVISHLFSEPTNVAPTTTVLEVIRSHFRFQLELRDVEDAVRQMRKHLAWYSRDFPNGTEFRRGMFRQDNPSQVLDSVERFFGRAIIT